MINGPNVRIPRTPSLVPHTHTHSLPHARSYVRTLFRSCHTTLPCHAMPLPLTMYGYTHVELVGIHRGTPPSV